MQYVSVASDITNHYQLLPLLFPCSITFRYRRNRIANLSPPFTNFMYHLLLIILQARVNILLLHFSLYG